MKEKAEAKINLNTEKSKFVHKEELVDILSKFIPNSTRNNTEWSASRMTNHLENFRKRRNSSTNTYNNLANCQSLPRSMNENNVKNHIYQVSNVTAEIKNNQECFEGQGDSPVTLNNYIEESSIKNFSIYPTTQGCYGNEYLREENANLSEIEKTSKYEDGSSLRTSNEGDQSYHFKKLVFPDFSYVLSGDNNLQ